jgi:hypothetical protein
MCRQRRHHRPRALPLTLIREDELTRLSSTQVLLESRTEYAALTGTLVETLAP